MAAEKVYRAITEIHITETPGKHGDKSKGVAPTPPKVHVVPAKARFSMDPDSDLADELLSKGAAVLDTSKGKDDVIKVGSSTKKPSAKKSPAKPDAKPNAKPDAKTDAKTGSDDAENLV